MFLPARRVELEFHCDGDRWSHLESTRSRNGLLRHLLILPVETLPIRLEVLHWDLRSLRSVPALEWVLGHRSLFLTVLLYHLLLGRWIHNLFVWSIHPSRLFFEDKNLMHTNFSKSSNSAINISSFQIPPAIRSQPRKIPGNTFLPNWWFLDWSFGEVGWYSTIPPKGIIGPLTCSPNRLSYGVFPSARRSWTFPR